MNDGMNDLRVISILGFDGVWTADSSEPAAQISLAQSAVNGCLNNLHKCLTWLLMPYWMGGILLDAKTDRHGPQDTPRPRPPRLAFYAFKKAAIISLTMTQFTASAIPFGFHQSRAAVDGDLIGRVNQEVTSGGLKRPCWTQKSPLVKVSIWEWMGQSQTHASGLWLDLEPHPRRERETDWLRFTMLMKSAN